MFQVIGERINTSRIKVQAAVIDRDVHYITNDIKMQQEAGANFIDVNAGARIGHEQEDMKWLLDTIRPVATVPQMMASGMDSAIIDPLDLKIMSTIRTADMLFGRDDFCMNYLKEVRSGSIRS